MPNILKSSDPSYRSDVKELKNELEEGCGEYPEMYRGYYRKEFGSETVLTDDQIYLMVGNSDDADDPEGWAKAMRQLENELTEPQSAA